MIDEQYEGADGTLCGVALPRADSSSAPLVMHHGVTRRWQTFLPLFPSLNHRRAVYAFDARGHGGSSRASSGDYLVVDYVDDLVRIVNANFDRPVVLYGHSLGAMVVAAAAARLGQQVAAVIMEDPPMSAMGQHIDQSSLLSLFQAFLRVHAWPPEACVVRSFRASVVDARQGPGRGPERRTCFPWVVGTLPPRPHLV